MERRYIKTRTLFDYETYRCKCCSYKAIVDRIKTEYYCERFGNCDDRKLFHLVKQLSVPSNEVPSFLASSSDLKTSLVNKFSLFFQKKVEMLRLDLKDTMNTRSLHSPPKVCSTTLSEFKLQTVDEVEYLVKKSKTKACAIDLVPTSIVNLCIGTLSKYIAIRGVARVRHMRQSRTFHSMVLYW